MSEQEGDYESMKQARDNARMLINEKDNKINEMEEKIKRLQEENKNLSNAVEDYIFEVESLESKQIINDFLRKMIMEAIRS